MIRLDVSTLQNVFDRIDDLDGNGIVSEGDRIHVGADVYTVAASYANNLSTMAAFLSNISGREFRALVDTGMSNRQHYLAWSQAGSRNTIESLYSVGVEREESSGDTVETNYYDQVDAAVNLAVLDGAWEYAGCVSNQIVKRHANQVGKYNAAIASICANWTKTSELESLLDRDNAAQALNRLERKAVQNDC